MTLLLSGGGDSTALFHLLREIDQPFSVLHFVHDGQADFAAAGRDFCTALCSEYGVSLDIEEIRGKELGGDLSWEAACRHLRYASLKAREGPFLTAHTADDQAETVVMRLLGGAGLAGLGGIYPVRDDGVLRPVLEFERKDLRCYLRANGWSWLEDPTNRDGNRRAIVRAQIMPVLLEREPALLSILGRTAQRLRDDEEYLLSATRKAMKSLGDQAGDSWSLSGLQALPAPLLARFLKAAGKALSGPGFRPRATLIEEATRLIRRGTNEGRVLFPGGWSLWVLGSRVWVCPALPPEQWEAKPDRDGELFPGMSVSLSEKPGWTAWPLPEGAILRSRRPGDRFQGKSLKKLLASSGQPPWVRNRWPMLVKGDQVLAVYGRPLPSEVDGQANLWICFQPERLRAKVSEK